MGLLLHTADHHPRLAKVALGVAREMGQGDEHLPCLAPPLPYVVLDYGVLARESMLAPQTLVEALGRVALLAGNLEIIFQNPVDDAGERLQLGAAGRVLPPVARRRGVGQHLAHRVPVQAEHPRRLPDTHAFDHHRPANPQIHVHFVHLSHHP